MSRGSLWTEEETAVLREMMAAGCSYTEMMAKIGRSKHSIKERWRWINHSEEERAKRRKQINLNRNIRTQFGNGVSPTRLAPRVIPEEVTAHRAARIAAGPRDLSGAFFGDPPRGFSALDRKLRGEKDPVYIDHSQAQLQRKPSLAGAA
jgi:hypothetical protein